MKYFVIALLFILPQFSNAQETDLDKFNKKLASPLGIGILSTIGGINSAILRDAAEEQENEAEENIKKVEKILTTYKDSWTEFCPHGRDKLEDAACYCYLDNGKQNTKRSNSKTCIDLWAKNKYFFESTADTYNSANGPIDPAGCLTRDGQFDERCRCKKFVDAKGQNACMKSVPLSINNNILGNSFLSASGFDKVMSNLNSTVSGNSNLASLDENGLRQAIAKQKKINQAIMEKLLKDPKLADFKKSMDNIDKIQKAIFTPTELAKVASTGGGSALTSLPEISPDKAQVLQDVKNKIGLDMSGSGKGLNTKKGEKKNSMDFNFSGDSAGGSASAGVIQDFPEKNYKYTNSDIVTDDSASIFEIISNRYVLSGLKRLFDDEATPEN